MKAKFLFFAVTIVGSFLVSCNSGTDDAAKDTPPKSADSATNNAATGSGDESKGVGKFKQVELTHPLDQKMVAGGKSVYDLKCASCHKLTDEKLVGPGWKGVTDRRTPEWVMNFVTNTEEMLEKNQAAKNLYEVCLVKMPNQNLSDDDARHVLEFMRNNDGKK
jgi:cytochrome c551/c552